MGFQKQFEHSQPQSNVFVIDPSIKTKPYNTRRSPRTGRLSVSAESYIREQREPNFKLAMEVARAALADDYKHILEANNFAGLRLSKGLSQTSLAAMIGTSQSHVAKIEAKLLDVKFSTATKIADALAVSLDTLRPYISITGDNAMELKPSVSAL